MPPASRPKTETACLPSRSARRKLPNQKSSRSRANSHRLQVFVWALQKSSSYFIRGQERTRRIARELAGILGGDLEEIRENRPRTGWLGYLRSAMEAKRMQCAAILPMNHEVNRYDLVLIGTPVWAWSVSSPVRAFLKANATRLPNVAFFCTLGGAGSESAFAQMEALVGKKARATCAITEHAVKAETYGDQLAAFVLAVRNTSS